MGLSFGQVVDVLTEANSLSPARRERFISRLKQWQKMGFPEGVNVGKGARADYGAKQLFQLAFHLRMLALGLTPERAQSILKIAWNRIQDAITSVTILTAQGKGGGHYLLIGMAALTELKDGPDDGHMHIYVRPTEKWMIADSLEPDDKELTPDEIPEVDAMRLMVLDAMVNALIIEVDSIVWRIWVAMKKLNLSPSLLTDDTQEWVKQFAKRQKVGKKEHHELPEVIDNLSNVEGCIACFAGELLGLNGHDHESHSTAEGTQDGND